MCWKGTFEHLRATFNSILVYLELQMVKRDHLVLEQLELLDLCLLVEEPLELRLVFRLECEDQVGKDVGWNSVEDARRVEQAIIDGKLCQFVQLQLLVGEVCKALFDEDVAQLQFLDDRKTLENRHQLRFTDFSRLALHRAPKFELLNASSKLSNDLLDPCHAGHNATALEVDCKVVELATRANNRIVNFIVINLKN